MGYCFMHIDPIKTYGIMSNCFRHNYRMKFVENAIPELEQENEELVSLNGKTYEQAYRERATALGYGIDKSFRKNGVLALEVLTSFSREDRTKINVEQWKKDNVEWLRKAFNANPEKYGDNVLSVVYHADEVGNIHCHAFIIPVDDKGKINASFYRDGKMKMLELQNSYADKMKAYGLKRGIEGSIANHENIKRFYTELNQAVDVKIPEYTKEDTLETYKAKIDDFTKTLQASHLRELKAKDREIVVAKSIPKQETTILRRDKAKIGRKLDALEREIGDLEREFGPMKNIKSMLKTTSLLNDALKNYPDTDRTAAIIAEINQLIEWEREERRKEEEREKNRTKTPYEKLMGK